MGSELDDFSTCVRLASGRISRAARVYSAQRCRRDSMRSRLYRAMGWHWPTLLEKRESVKEKRQSANRAEGSHDQHDFA